MESKLTILLLLVLGAGLALGAWYLLSDDSSPDSGRTAAGPAPHEGPAAPEQPPAEVAGEVEEFAPISTDAFEDEELFAAGGEPRQVLVVDRDRQPVPGAEVTLRVRDRSRTPDRATPGRRTLRTLRSDEHGFAPLNPLPRGRLTIEARAEDAFGFAVWVEDAEARRKLDLPEGADALVIVEPIRHLEVAVVDHLGAPAPHVEVGVAATARATPGRRSDLERVLRTGPSLGNLRSPAPDAVLGIPLTTAQRGLYRAESVQIMAVLPGMDPTSTTVALEPEGTTRAVLALPPTVLLHLRVREAGSEELVTFPVKVTWTVPLLNEPKNGRELRRLLQLRHSLTGTFEIEEGSHSVGGFAPGATVSFEVRAPERVPWKHEVILPSTESQVEIALEAGPVRPFLTARLLEPDGRPAERLRLQARIESSRGDIAEEQRAPDVGGFVRGPDGDDDHPVTTDDDGNVRIPVEPGTVAFVKLVDTSSAARTHRKGLVAELSLPELEPGEVRDLGDVTLDRGALLVAGVVMARDVPENDALIEARRIAPAPGGSAPRGRFRGTLGKVSSGAEGKFFIYGSSEITGEIELRARSGKLQSEADTVPVGSTDVILPLIETGSLRGRVVLADPALRTGISLRLASQDGESSQRLVIPQRRATSEKAGAGAFEFKRLMPGLYDLTVLVADIESTTVRDLEVRSGEECTPAAIEELVVGGEFLRARVEVRTPSGEPVVRAQVSFDDRSEASGRGRQRTRRGVPTDRQGVAEMVVRSGALVALTIEAKGYATRRMTSAAFPLVITLEPGLEVTLEFTDPLPQVEDISRYRIALEPRNPDSGVSVRRLGDGSTFRSGEREATFENVPPGAYLVRLQPLPPAMGRGDPEKWRNFLRRPPVDLGEISIPSAPPLKWRVSRDTSQLAEQVRAFLDS